MNKRRASEKSDEIPLEKLAGFFHILGDPTRLDIFSTLLASDVPLSVSEMTRRTGFGRPNISKHLSDLKRANLVDVKRDGTFRFYSANREHCRSLLEATLSRVPPSSLSPAP